MTDKTVESDGMDGIVALLRYADPDEVEHPWSPPPDLEGRIIDRVRAERDGKVASLDETRRRRRDRRPLILAAAAAVLAAVLGVATLAQIGDDTPSSGETVALSSELAGIDGSAELVEGEGVTEIRLIASGLNANEVYAAWLAPAEGEKLPAGTFRADEDGRAEVDLVSSYPLESAARVWVTDPAGETVLNADLS